jgi:putative tryptophan/tyrosine transport system substrate-binding protein
VLKETLPGLTRVGYLANPDYVAHAAQRTEMEAAARRLSLTLHLAEARTPAEFEGAFARLAAAHVGAFIVQQDSLFGSHRALVIKLATQHRLPGMSVWSFYPQSGGFMSYGAKPEDLHRRAADYLDKILKGAQPSDLPVERPTTFELVINLKTADTLGLTIPPTLLFQATEVIR